MPAYAEKIGQRICPNDGKKATHTVYNVRGAVIGDFCAKCATGLVADLNAELAREVERLQRRRGQPL